MNHSLNIGNDRVFALPERFLIFTRSGLLVAGSILGTSSVRMASGHSSALVRGQRMNRMVSVSRLIGSLLCVLSRNRERPPLSRFDGARRFDSSTQSGKAMVLRSTSLCRLASSHYSMRMGRHRFEYSWRVGVSSLGLLLRRSGNDLLSIYLGLEWSSLCFYVLASIRRGSAYSTEAGLKYFVMGAVSSGIYLFGASMIYGRTGSIQLGEINRRRMGERMGVGSLMRMRGCSMVRVAFLFKLAIAPFHAWSPDVYEGSPTPSSLYFASVPKRAMVLVLLRLVYQSFGPLVSDLQSRRRRTSMRSRTVAALAARSQRRWKRFRAYSAIGHMGYLMLGVSCGTVEGIQSARIYMRVYIVMSLSAWIGMMSVTSVSLSNSSSEGELVSAKYRTDLQGLHRRNAFLARSISLTVRSMAGIPPRAGFLPKFWVFFSAMSENRFISSLFAVLASCIGAYYYLRWVKRMYFDGMKKERSTSSEYGDQALQRTSLIARPIALDESSGRILSGSLFLMRTRLMIPGPLRMISHRMALAFILS